ncbi:Asp23/Gls24 family envelope stress response protein [Aerococcus urinaeequi]|uniref:Stress response regulator gls24 homolog n=1 Tax=Aerococcus viridans TaxID=1377 RepID=A0A2N6UDF6_9LACT|nr:MULTISPECIES: Asp23/Gls24 family envelope stress response protein [Aerococcus]OFU52877.1 alkaline-shock protein [Aerococcus sp. HMSC10H05]PMC79608.1 Asp23/Gls24 family envelope stress response protein [Aerococcus viridans]
MVETNEQVKHENNLAFEPRVLERIANNSVQDIDGILELKGNFTSGVKSFFSSEDDQTKGVNAEVGSKEVAIDLEVIAEYGKNIPAAFDKTIEKVKANVEKMTGLKVVEVNMNVNDVMTRADYQQQQTEEERKRAEERRRAHQNGEYTDGSRVQ